MTVPLKLVSGQWWVGREQEVITFCTKIRVKPREDSYLSLNWGVIIVRRRHFTVIKPQRYTDRGMARTDSYLALF